MRESKESNIVQEKAGTSRFLKAIELILQKCPRELLLVMKTNDLLRSIHNELSVVNEGHLITMARNLGWNCLACIYRNERENLEWNEKIELWKIALKLLVLSFKY